MKRVLSYLKAYRAQSVLAPVFKMAEAVFDLMIPLVVSQIIDIGIKNSDRRYVVGRCGLLLLFAVGGVVFSITAQYFSAKAAIGMATELRGALFSHIHSFSYTELDSFGTSTLITRLTEDVNQVQTGINLTLRLLLRSPFIVFGALILAYTIDARSALAFAIAVPVLALIIFLIMAKTIPMYRSTQGKLDSLLVTTRENLSGVRVLRAFCKEEEERGTFERKNATLNASQKRVGRISMLTSPLTYVVVNLAIIMILWQSGVRVNSGLLSQGAVVALYNYMSQILFELIRLADLIVSVTRGIACAKRIDAVLGTEPGDAEKSLPSAAETCPDGAVVSFHDVSFRYAGAAENALDHITFSAKKGETVGIIGGTGSGKSTLVQLIPRFYEVTDGEIFIDGAPIVSYESDNLRSKIGYVPQHAMLFRGTLRDNLLFGAESIGDERLVEALRTAQAEDFVQKKGGLDFALEQGGRNLSGGQKQRLTIARALVRQPEILILDDSSSALDFATDAHLRSALSSLSFSPTVFLVSQRISAVKNADCIFVLNDGRLVGQGTHDELLSACDVYRDIYSSQLQKEGE